MLDPAVGWSAVAIAVASFGSFAVPAKCFAARSADVHPLVYQTYKSFWCFATSWLVLLVPGVRLTFTPFGLLSALSWVPAGIMAIWSVNCAGLGVAQATWSSMIVLVSFAWGVLVFREPVGSWPMAAGAVVLMIVGIAGMAIFSDPSRRAKRDKRAEVSASLLDAGASCESPVPIHTAAACAGTEHPSAVEGGGGTPPAPGSTFASPSAAPAASPPGQRRRKGLLIAVISGTYGGSLPAGIKAAQRLAPNQPVGFEFIISFGIGAASVTACCWLLHWLILELICGYPRPSLQLRTMAGPGAVAGLTWSLGNAASVLAVTHLGSALGYSACQASLIVSGLWGILYFREVSGIDALIWLAFAALGAAALVALAFQMHSGEHSGPHAGET